MSGNQNDARKEAEILLKISVGSLNIQNSSAQIQDFDELRKTVLQTIEENVQLRQKNFDLLTQLYNIQEEVTKLKKACYAIPKEKELQNQIEKYKDDIENIQYPKKIRSKIEFIGLNHFQFSANKAFSEVVKSSQFSNVTAEIWLKHLKSDQVDLLPLKHFLLLTNLSSEYEMLLDIDKASYDLQNKSQVLNFIAATKTKILSMNETDDPFLNHLKLYFNNNSLDSIVQDSDKTFEQYYCRVLDDFAKSVSNLYTFIVSDLDFRSYTYSYQIYRLNYEYENTINSLFHFFFDDEYYDN